MHSTWSDGTDTPRNLLKKVREAGIDVFSVTDHDEYRGILELNKHQGKQPEDGAPAFIPGTEFSCRDGGDKFHILGYAYDTEAPSIRGLFDAVRTIRMQKAENRIRFLKQNFGFTFSDEEYSALMRNHNPGKPHIAKLMVNHGYAENISEAIDRYIAGYHGPERRIKPEEAIEAILAADGLPVLAHGPFGDGGQDLGPEEMERRVSRLKAAGLAGVEAYYSGFSAAQRDMMLDLADRNGLTVTAGSDYHGSIKAVRLGDTGPGDPAEKAARLADFLAEALRRSTFSAVPERPDGREGE